ncbi:MAG TPA: methyltransferase domain-containing protein [Candidatus Mailhella merdavium]|nr:methyltransferase domain-containing protein [Candidatus Mailhella merdavium]
MPLKTAQYDQDFLKANMMGPNAILILEELLDHLSLSSRMRILDLGCGKGLSSIFLAREYKARIFALDLWIPATDNHIRFQKTGLDDFIVPIHADAHELPFANHFFDAVISVDSYHYFGNNDTFFSEKIRPLLKKGGLVALAFPGLKSELQTVPEAMKPYWKEEELPMLHSAAWWKELFKDELHELHIWEMACFKEAWKSWLDTDNPYAVQDRAMLRTDNDRFMNLIGITGTVS